jgi:hypothetical protein
VTLSRLGPGAQTLRSFCPNNSVSPPPGSLDERAAVRRAEDCWSSHWLLFSEGLVLLQLAAARRTSRLDASELLGKARCSLPLGSQAPPKTDLYQDC